MNPRKVKMRNLFYTELKIQEYLKDDRITTSQARAVFRYKTRMANLPENFKGGAETKPCPMCKDALDTQQHSFNCRVILENIEVEGQYSEVFFSKVQPQTAKTLESMLKFREEYVN